MPVRIEPDGQYLTPYYAGDYLSVLFDGNYYDDYPMFLSLGTAGLYIDIPSALVTEVAILINRGDLNQVKFPELLLFFNVNFRKLSPYQVVFHTHTCISLTFFLG